MNNIALGRYLPLDSALHKVDPRFKLIGMLMMLTAIFLNVGWIGYLFLALMLLIGVIVSKIRISFFLKSFKPMMYMMIFLLIINILSLKTGTLVFTLGSFKIYSDALLQTAYIMVRLVLMITVTTLLTASTAPLDMTLGIEDLLKPLRRFGVPAHEIALMISIALRFIPTLIEEAQRIMQAQASRGVDFQEGTIKEKVSGILSLIVPLFVSAFQRAEDLADAMEARGYAPGKPRTRYKQLIIRHSDWFFLIFIILILAVCIYLAVM
ncbi:MAG: energy-coupling factor transporter transmembrane protein EcfT [Erysipelothrix sp.]|nr:energy-coupling factor transporter transmembrane protein EcfT [Erysipelothrix sp.]